MTECHTAICKAGECRKLCREIWGNWRGNSLGCLNVFANPIRRLLSACWLAPCLLRPIADRIQQIHMREHEACDDPDTENRQEQRDDQSRGAKNAPSVFERGPWLATCGDKWRKGED